MNLSKYRERIKVVSTENCFEIFVIIRKNKIFDLVYKSLKVNYSWGNGIFALLNLHYSKKINKKLSLNYCSPGSAGSLAKSANGSMRSEMSRSGSGGDVSDIDGDNINVVVRVRPLSQKENRNHDEGIVQFPGEGQIWVRFLDHLFSIIIFHLL